MSPWLQNLLALSACLLAGVYISWRAVGVFRKKAGSSCGTGCGSCPTAKGDVPGKSLMQIEVTKTKSEMP